VPKCEIKRARGIFPEPVEIVWQLIIVFCSDGKKVSGMINPAELLYRCIFKCTAM